MRPVWRGFQPLIFQGSRLECVVLLYSEQQAWPSGSPHWLCPVEELDGPCKVMLLYCCGYKPNLNVTCAKIKIKETEYFWKQASVDLLHVAGGLCCQEQQQMERDAWNGSIN